MIEIVLHGMMAGFKVVSMRILSLEFILLIWMDLTLIFLIIRKSRISI